MASLSPIVTTRSVIQAYNTTLVYAEPHLLDLWNKSMLTLAQLRVIRVLTVSEQMTATALAEATRILPTSLSRILPVLEERGLIERQTDPGDQRRTLINATPEGRALNQGLLVGSKFEEAVARLSQRDRAALQRLLLVLNDHLAAVSEDPSAAGPAQASAS
jgi:DNA-binding MarR family transcriptional regulator